MKKKIILMGIAGVLVLTTMIGGTLAAFQATSSQGTSDITTKDLNIYISENDAEGLALYQSGVMKAMPGEIIDENLKAVFASSANYDAYICITVYKAWGDAGENSSFAKSYDTALELDKIKIIPENAEDWIVIENDEETMTMYYKKPLSESSKTETSKFINQIQISKELGNQYADLPFIIEASADAVQSIGGAEAIKSAWGVTAVLDSEKNITDIVVE